MSQRFALALTLVNLLLFMFLLSEVRARDAAPVLPILLALPGAPSLHVNVPSDQCPNVTSFQVDTDEIHRR